VTAIRPMTPADIAGALPIFAAVGWGDHSAHLHFFIARADAALFVAEDGGRIVGCSGTMLLGPTGTPRSGWVHGVVVDPGARRAGLGRRLTETAVAWLRERGVPTINLLATGMGRPIYERLGFQLERRYRIFRRTALEDTIGAIPGLRRMQKDDIPAVLALGRDATGEDRSALLRPFLDGGWVVARDGDIAGFHVPCPWHEGPSIARDAAAGAILHDLSRRLYGTGTRSISLPEDNHAGVVALAASGAEARGAVDRMWLGAPAPIWRPEMIYGVVSLGLA